LSRGPYLNLKEAVAAGEPVPPHWLVTKSVISRSLNMTSTGTKSKFDAQTTMSTSPSIGTSRPTSTDLLYTPSYDEKLESEMSETEVEDMNQSV
jgi:hypothetical protein